MSAPTDKLSQCLAAIDALYNHADSSVKHQADLWLIALLNSPECWVIADQILHTPNLQESAYLYAANGLLQKLQVCFYELTDANQRTSFRNSLLSHAARFADLGSPLIKSKLAQAVAVLTVHLTGVLNTTQGVANGTTVEWTNAIAEIFERFGKDPNASNRVLMLLDILTFLPEENLSDRLFIHSTVRARAQREMMAQSEQIISMLMQYLETSTLAQAPDGTVKGYVTSGILLTPNLGPQAVPLPHVSGVHKSMHTKILATFLAWVKGSSLHKQIWAAGVAPPPSEPILSSEKLVSHPLLLFCFKIIASRCDELEQIAIDALSSFLYIFHLPNYRIKERGFHSASEELDEQDGSGDEEEEEEEEEEFGARSEEGQWNTGSFAPSNQPGAQEKKKPNPFQHIYFMRFMIQHILELQPLFDALSTKGGASEDEEALEWYAGLFSNLAEYYLAFILEFCLGAKGFSEEYDKEAAVWMNEMILRHHTLHPQVAQQLPPGTNHVQALIESNQQLASGMMGIVVKCAKHPNLKVNLYIQTFFRYLNESLKMPIRVKNYRSTSQANPNVVSPYQIRAQKRDLFIPILTSLILDLHRMAMLPEDWQPPGAQTAPLSSEELEELKDVRAQVGASLAEFAGILGFEPILELLTSPDVIGAQVAKCHVDPSNWRPVEATLFLIYHLGPIVTGDYEDAAHYVGGPEAFRQGGPVNTVYIPRVLELILNPTTTPFITNQAVKYTALRVLRVYASWMHECSQALKKLAPTEAQIVDYLPRALNAVVSGLQDTRVCRAAAHALREVCEHNRVQIASSTNPPYIESLMTVYAACCTVAVVGVGTNQHGFTINDQLCIIEGVSAIVSCVPSPKQPGEPDRLPHFLHQLVLPMVTEITKIIQQAQTIQPNAAGAIILPSEVGSALASHLERLAETIARLDLKLSPNKDHFIVCLLDLFQKTLAPLLYTIMQHLSNEERRMDKLCRVVRHVIKITKLEFLTNCLEPLIHALHAAFARYPHACFIHLLGVVIVDHFGVHPRFHPILAQMLPAFMMKSLSTIPNLQAMVNDPDMTEDFFMSCEMILKRCPNILFTLQILPQIVELALAGLQLTHRDSASSVTFFLSYFLMQGVNSPQGEAKRSGTLIIPEHQMILQQCFTKYGQTMADILIQCISATGVPTDQFRGLERVFYAFISFTQAASRPWFTTALAKIPPTADPTHEEFLEMMYADPLKHPITHHDLEHFRRACKVKKEIKH